MSLSDSITPARISVIGLGNMGYQLAHLLLQAGHHVTVWNRTPAKAAALVARGAAAAATVSEAVQASPIILVCVHNYEATTQLFRGAETALLERVVVQLTTGSAAEAREAESWARHLGAAYLDGAIQAAPEQMGRPDTTILLSGAEPAFKRVEPALRELAGNLVYLGPVVGAAAVMDLATLSFVYGSVAGFFHGVMVCEAEEIDVSTYGAIIASVTPGYGEFLQHEAGVIQSGDFSVSQSPMSINIEATERLLATAGDMKVPTEFPAFIASLFARAAQAGLATEELAALIKVMRAGAGQ